VTDADLELRAVNTIRFLSVDMVEKAKSGHPGLPLGAAPIAYVLWMRYLRHNPANPRWWNRDRFVLSAGHGSALLYSLLHLTGYDLPMEELQRFRQFGSRTPGHPEYGRTPGVETTTGPLGQGFSAGVGMALAERYLESRYNRPGFPIIDHWTYALCSDGDLMEGISSEAASFAGSMKVNKMLYLYDDNRVSLEGPTNWSFVEDVSERFAAYGWHVEHVEDGNDLAAIDAAIRRARAVADRPSLIRIRTHIGYGSPRQDTKDAHGEPLGPDATKATKQKLGWPLEPTFLIPDEVREHFRRSLERGKAWEDEWNTQFAEYERKYPDRARELKQVLEGRLPPAWDAKLPTFTGDPSSMATREASSLVMKALAETLPNFFGGAADLAPSTRTTLEGFGDFTYGETCGRNLHFGVRENAMVGMLNGMVAHGGPLPYGATFLIFSDYARPAIRISALMRAHHVLVFTHDSVGLGEDGPTHQPVEHLAGLRAIPDYTVIRPADANETTEAWRLAIQRTGPVALVLTRQKLPVLDASKYPIRQGVARGGYVLSEASGGTPEVVLIGTGSEVHLCLAAQGRLAERSIRARVVSLPSWEMFDEQPPEYRSSVLVPNVPKVTVEAASPLGWERYAGNRSRILGLTRFGASAPGALVLERLGFTADRVVEAALELTKP
jgi:transketolase